MRQKLITLLLFVMALYMILPQGGDLNASGNALQDVSEDISQPGFSDTGYVSMS